MQLSISNQTNTTIGPPIVPLIHLDPNDSETLFTDETRTTKVNTSQDNTSVRCITSKGSIPDVYLTMNTDNMMLTRNNTRNNKRGVYFDNANGIWTPRNILSDKNSTGATMLWIGVNVGTDGSKGFVVNFFVNGNNTNWTTDNLTITTLDGTNIGIDWGSGKNQRTSIPVGQNTPCIVHAEASSTTGCKFQSRVTGTNSTYANSTTRPYLSNFFSSIHTARCFYVTILNSTSYPCTKQILYELLIYEGILTSTQLTAVTNYLIQKWAL